MKLQQYHHYNVNYNFQDGFIVFVQSLWKQVWGQLPPPVFAQDRAKLVSYGQRLAMSLVAAILPVFYVIVPAGAKKIGLLLKCGQFFFLPKRAANSKSYCEA